MKYTSKRNNNTLTITFKMDMTEWATFDKKAYEQNKGKYSVPGFRKGHVPKSVLENRYGKGLFFDLPLPVTLLQTNITVNFWIKIKRHNLLLVHPSTTSPSKLTTTAYPSQSL